MKTWTAEEIAQFDQMMAECYLQIDGMTRLIRELAAESSPHQAIANFSALLERFPPDHQTGLLLGCLMKLAAEDARAGH